jgi:alkylhydroperoxidase family enzyme
LRAALVAAAALAVLVLTACATTATPPLAAFSARAAAPRIAPVPPEARDAEQRRMMQGKGNANIYTTLANHVPLADAWTPFANYTFNGSKTPPRYREMAILRMGWLCQAHYEWSQHALIAQRNGLTEAEVMRVAQGPAAPGWTDIERRLLTAVDELRYDGAPSAQTWAVLKSALGEQPAMDALMTAAQYEMTSMMLNSAGVQLDPNLRDRLPANLPPPRPAARPQRAINGPPAEQALAPDQALAQGLVMLDHGLAQSGLTARQRAILALRTDYLLHADSEWTRNAVAARAAGLSPAEIERIKRGSSAHGWAPADHALLLAADDLRREAFITDPTWAALTRHFDRRAALAILYVVGDASLNARASGSFPGGGLAPQP